MIGEQGNMIELHGKLYIINLENICCTDEASQALLNKKKHLNALCFKWISDWLSVGAFGIYVGSRQTVEDREVEEDDDDDADDGECGKEENIHSLITKYIFSLYDRC